MFEIKWHWSRGFHEISLCFSFILVLKSVNKTQSILRLVIYLWIWWANLFSISFVPAMEIRKSDNPDFHIIFSFTCDVTFFFFWNMQLFHLWCNIGNWKKDLFLYFPSRHCFILLYQFSRCFVLEYQVFCLFFFFFYKGNPKSLPFGCVRVKPLLLPNSSQTT